MVQNPNSLELASASIASGAVEFYGAVAQIIPVLLLAYLFQLRYDRRAELRSLAKVWGAVNVLMAMNAEAISLYATFRRGEVGDWAASWTWAGVASLFLTFAYLLFLRILRIEKWTAARG
ncbi:hypothetical protein [Kitasatospora griseola]|uniref:hypothetical protein n=1 Tax=Kitasatospora griseola TaxID=2064 RepID=UPI00128BA610|nr:hypothetical protein [Kitasatospora griseola]